MDEKDLRKLNRAELLEMLIDAYKEVDALKAELAEKDEKLQQRELIMENAGSLAEASLQLNGVFTAAQAAVDQYVSAVKSRWETIDAACQARERETAEKSRRILEEAEKHAVEMEEEARHRSQTYWDAIYAKLEEKINEHSYLKDEYREEDPDASTVES